MGIQEDLAFAGAVRDGDSSACARVIDEYSDLTLSHVVELMKCGHCRQSARTAICSLLIIQRQKKGIAHYPDEQCDECMNSYLWFIEILKNRIGAYKGRNNCSLSTFAFSILKSHSTYIDWLRWKYKRCDRPPKCIAQLDKVCHKVFEYLCERKTDEVIAEKLSVPEDEARTMIHRVKTELIRAGQIDLVESFQHVSIHSDDPDEQEIPLPSNEPGMDEVSIERQRSIQINRAINELPAHLSRITRLHYKEGMSAKDILGFIKETGLDIFPKKETADLKEQDIYYAINKAIKELRNQLKGMHL